MTPDEGITRVSAPNPGGWAGTGLGFSIIAMETYADTTA